MAILKKTLFDESLETINVFYPIAKMDLKINIPTDLTVELVKLQKMSFIYNALDDGWTIRKRDDKYIFTKKHEGKKEVYLDTFLPNFIEANLKLDKFN